MRPAGFEPATRGLERPCPSRKSRCPPAFRALSGRAWDYRRLGRAVLAPASGLHAPLHTRTTDPLRAVVPVVTVSRMLGHHDVGFTLGTDGHLVDSDLPDLDTVFGRTGR